MSAFGELARVLGSEAVLPGDSPEAARYLSDATESRAIRGRTEAVVRPASPEQVADVVRWCYDHDVPLVPRGGGTGYAGGAVPVEGAVVVALERLREPIQVDPAEWRARVSAGMRTAELRRRARESGLVFPPDPGAAESSTVGGNLATNAGGPHSFKYGVTGAWATAVQAVIAPGELVRFGAGVRKDVAGYDLRSLLIGSEGTLGIITGGWFRLIPAPVCALPVVGFYPDLHSGCAAISAVLGEGLVPAALEFLDGGAVSASLDALIQVAELLPPSAGRAASFMVIAEADGGEREAAELRAELRRVLGEGATGVYAPTGLRDVGQLWRWRDGVSLAVTARRGGKLSEDIVVPVERVEDVLGAIEEIGGRHQLDTCCWGHAGDGNLHATFLIDRAEADQVARAEAAAGELFALALAVGGSISGEHGIGLVKRAAVEQQFPAPVRALHEQVKRVFDPKWLLNPGKKLAG